MEAQQTNIPLPDGGTIHVMNVPNCFFNGVQVCLATKDKNEIKRCRYMVPRFKKYLDECSRRDSAKIITPIGLN